VALDIKNIEIELYWKRETYFLAFIVLAFTGYVAVFTAKDVVNKNKLLLLITGLVVVFSSGWYFLNRGSKLWQIYWEKHVDLLEDYNIGPLHKSVMLKTN